ncbi:uncharacterized protein [Battus philenor]|uniref:uncharacterized protein n=1 Tax=Battus philenor TaxID=42288 RepID=UPI0035CF3CEB
MLIQLFIYYFTLKVTLAQINGEFWRLNDNLPKLNNVKSSRSQFDKMDLDGRFDIEAKTKAALKEDKSVDNDTKSKEIEATISLRDHSTLATSKTRNSSEINITQNNNIDFVNKIKKEMKHYNDDIFNFVYSNEEENMKRGLSNKSEISNFVSIQNSTDKSVNKSVLLNHKIILEAEEEVPLSENICTYMKETECYRCNGSPYVPKVESNFLKTNSQRICCILPITKYKSSKVYLPDRILYYNRLKRSNDEKDISPALKQRKILMQRKYGAQTSSTGPTATTSQKIVTPDEEYIDPYWNIKNSNLKKQNTQDQYETGSFNQEYDNDYIYNDYYTAELPKPSLVGLYSDHRPASWTFIYPNKGFTYGDVDSVVDEIQPSGYSTIDPRLGDVSSTASNSERRLLKLPTNSEIMPNSDSETVRYHSNPDFQVLQGFKLLNLKKKTNRPLRNLRWSSTTESFADMVEESRFESNIDNQYSDYSGIAKKLYTDCGRTQEDTQNYSCENALGESLKGTHPWLLLVVLTKKQQNILCYATLIHPRAAVTSADCTYGMSPGEITVIAGLWDLREKRSYLQYRIATVHAHQQYLPGKLAYNIALLHWRRPMRLDSHVQPACVAYELNIDEECIFVGWGGYDQDIRQRPRWQKASILLPDSCDERISTNDQFILPIDTFCASVNSKTTVTGPGGPLLCKMDGVFSVAGIAVWRNNVVVLMQPQEWVTRAMATLRIQ